LESILRQMDVTLEVIVVDDHSTDRTGMIADAAAVCYRAARRPGGQPWASAGHLGCATKSLGVAGRGMGAQPFRPAVAGARASG
jgi:hypothetical protein